jgi:hypothetical protein
VKRVEVGQQLRRKVPVADQSPVEDRRGHVGQDRLRRPPVRAVARPGTERTSGADDDPVDRRRRDHDATALLQPVRERPGQLSGPAFRNREAELLAEHRHQPPVPGTGRLLRAEIGVQSHARDQQPCAKSGERLLAVPAGGQREPAGQPERAGHPRTVHQRRGSTYGRKRGEEGGQQRLGDPLPVAVDGFPALAVAGREGVQRRRGRRHVPAQRRGAAVRQHVRRHGRCVRPAQPVRLEVQFGERRRPGGKRIERAEPVVDEPGRGERRGPDRSADLVLGLQHHDVPARVGEHVRRDEPVVPATDHDGVRGSACHR